MHDGSRGTFELATLGSEGVFPFDRHRAQNEVVRLRDARGKRSQTFGRLCDALGVARRG